MLTRLGLLTLSACAGTENTPISPAARIDAAVTVQAAVYDTAIDITSTFGGGGEGPADGIIAAGLVVGDQNSRPFTWQQPYGSVRILGQPPTVAGIGSATGVSPNGRWIAGEASPVGVPVYHAVAWDVARRPRDLGTLGGSNSWAIAVDDQGRVVGWAETARGVMHAFLYTPGSGMQDLGTLPGSFRSAQMQAWDINANGVIVGCGHGASGSYEMWSWTSAGGLQTLAPGVGFTCAHGVNSAGRITGVTDFQQPGSGFTWSGGRGFILHATQGGSGNGHDINRAGFAAGEENFTSAYVADPTGTVTYLPTLQSSPFPNPAAGAFAINDCGDVVGWANDPFLGQVRAVWWPGHQCS